MRGMRTPVVFLAVALVLGGFGLGGDAFRDGRAVAARRVGEHGAGQEQAGEHRGEPAG